MPEKAQSIMPPVKNDNVLPADFDGVFRFTNATDRDFTAKWNNIAYTYKAMSTSPMIISGATPEEVQHIRKKFARELAEREFYKSERYDELNKQALPGSGNVASIYTEQDLEPYIQKCLEPLPLSQASAKQLPRDDTKNYNTNTKVIDHVAFENQAPLVEGSAQIQ